MESRDISNKLKQKNLKDSLNDEEVAKAILTVMQKSKKWIEHEQMHKGAELVIIATPGLDTSFSQHENKLPGLVKDIEKNRTAQVHQTREVEITEEEEQILDSSVYGVQGQGNFGSVNYGTINGHLGNTTYGIQGQGQNNAMVIAGCPCGFFMQVAASNGKNIGMEEHNQNHRLGVSFGSVYSGNLDNLYSPQDMGSAGYGSNSVSYGGTSGSVKGYDLNDNPAKGFLDHEMQDGTGF